MKSAIADTLILFCAYVVAFLLRFDFGTPTWGWGAVLWGSLSALLLGWMGLLIFQCHRINIRIISLRNLPHFLGAIAFMVGVQLLLRYVTHAGSEHIYWRPPASVALIAGVLALLGLLCRRYIHRLQLRPVEIAEYLGRDEHEVDTPIVRAGFHNKVVLITGAGGSIGSELALQVLNAKPKRLLLCDNSEAALYLIHKQCVEHLGKDALSLLVPIVADCGDALRMRLLLQTEKPDFLLHAAAYKHVPMMELNPLEALRNNALSTHDLIQEAVAANVGTFLLISTDKAIAPTSVMGLTKRLAEIFVRDFTGRGKTKICAVRFGNVLGSSGSVVPLFREQIAKGGPVTVTDPRMERYFMTIAEACGLVLQSALMAKGGEIFVLDMGERITITSLAESMIRLAGLRPHKDIPIIYTGIRPGEKLREDLGVSPAQAEGTSHARIMVGRIPQLPHPEVETLLIASRALLSGSRPVTRDDVMKLWKEQVKDT